MYQYMYDHNFSDFQNFEVLNKYQLDQQTIGLSKVGFKSGYELKPDQEILHLKYQAVTFNLYGSMYMLQHYKINKDNVIGLMYLQSSNNFLQSSWDCLFQMISMFNLDGSLLEQLIKDEKKRIKQEQKLRVDKFMEQYKNDPYIKTLITFYDSKLKIVRKENNYVKHNGHVSSDANREKFKAARIDLHTAESELLDQELYRERGVNIEGLNFIIVECLNFILDFLDKYMEDNMDDVYIHLVSISKIIHDA